MNTFFDMAVIRIIRRLFNGFGLAWWARVETLEPKVTYWFGPFLTRTSLEQEMTVFEGELTREGASSVEHLIVRCRRAEPLTV